MTAIAEIVHDIDLNDGRCAPTYTLRHPPPNTVMRLMTSERTLTSERAAILELIDTRD